MKKSIIILFSLFYLTAVSGVTVSLHYCGGKIKSISFFDKKGNDCCCGNKKKSKNCCNQKSTFIKVKDNHHLSSSIDVNSSYFKIIATVFPTPVFEIPNAHTYYHTLNYHAPPVLYDKPLYLKHQVLII